MRGFTPAGVAPAQVFLENAENEKLVVAPLADVLLVFEDDGQAEPLPLAI